MKKANWAKRVASLLLLLAMLAGMLPGNVLAEQVGEAAETRDNSATKAAATETAQVRGYFDICDKIPDYENCISTQGMTVLGDYVYTTKKTVSDTDNPACTIFRPHRLNGTTEQMSIDGAASVNYLNHANDMCAVLYAADPASQPRNTDQA